MGSQLDDSAIERGDGRLRTSRDVEPAQDQVDGPFHRSFGDAQALANTPVGHALDNQFQNLEFAAAEVGTFPAARFIVPGSA